MRLAAGKFITRRELAGRFDQLCNLIEADARVCREIGPGLSNDFGRMGVSEWMDTLSQGTPRRPEYLAMSPFSPRLDRASIGFVVLIGVIDVARSASAAEPMPTVEEIRWSNFDQSREIDPPPPQGVADDDGPALKSRSDYRYDDVYRELRNGPYGLRALLSDGADPNVRNARGDPILFDALWNNWPGTVEALLDAGADPNGLRKGNVSPLSNAVGQGDVAEARLLLQYGADPDHVGWRKTTDRDLMLHSQAQGMADLAKTPPERLKAATYPTPGRRELRRPARTLGSERFTSIGGRALVFSPDGKQLIAGGGDGTIRVYVVASGLVEAGLPVRVVTAFPRGVMGLAVAPQRNLLVAADGETVRLFQLDTFAEIGRSRTPAIHLAISPDGRLLSAGGTLWSIESWQPFRVAEVGRRWNPPKGDYSMSAFFSPDGKHLVFRTYANKIWVWNVANDQSTKLPTYRHDKLTRGDLQAAIGDAGGGGDGPDDELLALAPLDQFVTGTPGTLQTMLRELPRFRACHTLAISPNGQYLAGIGEGRMQIYDVERDRDSDAERVGHSGYVTAVGFSPDGRYLASAGGDLTVRVWDLATGGQVAEFKIPQLVEALGFTPDGREIATGDSGGDVRLWDFAANRQTAHVGTGQPGITHLAFDREHQELTAVGGVTVDTVDLKTRKLKRSIFVSRSRAVAVSPDCRWIATAGDDRLPMTKERFPVLWAHEKAARLPLEKWIKMPVEDVRRPSHPVPTHVEVVSLAFSPDGKLLVSGETDGGVSFWDTTTFTRTGRIGAHRSFVDDVTISSDGKRLVTGGGFDGTARVWDLSTRRQLAVVDPDVRAIGDISLSPDGRTLATAGYNGTIQLWDLSQLDGVEQEKGQ